ncbi:MAG TPA: prepilin-type N-terminal cleavage/methylation domain-containing protein [Myxococcota bacterium]|nr:prepilin-type N-terminal cleavage/methylation domain-containing protein [Myxococcota bacterium]
MSRAARASAHRRGFTLIEVLAVVAILALAAVIVLPNLQALGERRLRHAAQRLAAELELARQRAVVTGIPHRVLFDLQNGVYRIEWLGGADEEKVQPVAAAQEYDVSAAAKLPLRAPMRTAIEFAPVPDSFGSFHDFEGDVRVAGLETSYGWIAEGLPDVVFERDGSAAYTEIVLEEPGGAHQTLAVLPLDDAVRYLDDEGKPR